MNDYVIRISFENGAIFNLDPTHVARHRALAFQKKFGTQVDVGKEIREGLEARDELTGWLRSKMDWKDVSSFVSRVCAPEEPPYEKIWKKGMDKIETEVIDVGSD